MWIGRSWGSLPTLHPHSLVKFRGPRVGLEARLYIEQITYGEDGTTVILTDRHAATLREPTP